MTGLNPLGNRGTWPETGGKDRQKREVLGSFRKEAERTGKSGKIFGSGPKGRGKAADDLQWRKSRRRLSQTQRPELPSVESDLLSLRFESLRLCIGIVIQIEDLDNSSTSTPRGIVNHCSRGFAFLRVSCFFPLCNLLGCMERDKLHRNCCFAYFVYIRFFL